MPKREAMGWAVVLVVLSVPLTFAQSWPDLATPAPAVGGGAHDYADPTNRSEALNLDVNYPGVGVRYFLSDKTGVEARAQYDKSASVGGARLYWYPRLLPAGSKLSPYLCAEGDYGSFKGAVTKGTGYAGGAFAGIEYSLARSFSLQIDAGSEYVSLKDKGTSLTKSQLEFVLNFGVNFYIKSGGSRTSEPEDDGNGRRAGEKYQRVKERAQTKDRELPIQPWF